MNIDQLMCYCRDNNLESVNFEFKNLKGVVTKGTVLDPYFENFILQGTQGFITSKKWKELTGDIFNLTINHE